MWADAQLDKRRLKEEYMSKVQHSSLLGPKVGPSQTSIAEGSQALPEIINTKDNVGSLVPFGNDHFLDPQCQNNINNMSAERNLLGQEFSTNTDGASLP